MVVNEEWETFNGLSPFIWVPLDLLLGKATHPISLMPHWEAVYCAVSWSNIDFLFTRLPVVYLFKNCVPKWYWQNVQTNLYVIVSIYVIVLKFVFHFQPFCVMITPCWYRDKVKGWSEISDSFTLLEHQESGICCYK